MSKARPITKVIIELRQVADDLRQAHIINNEWPESEMEARFEWMRLMAIIKNAEQEWKQVRQETLRLNQLESAPREENYESKS